jgi:hypothetical protein
MDPRPAIPATRAASKTLFDVVISLPQKDLMETTGEDEHLMSPGRGEKTNPARGGLF